MFESATLKLTGWYLLIIMIISLVFSLLVFQSASHEVSSRLEQFGQEIPQITLDTTNGWPTIRHDQLSKASHNIFMALVYINCLIFIIGGIVSYFMAKRTLRPLEEAAEAESRFVSNASHELRTPLAVMKSELEVALRDPKLSANEMRELLTSNLEEVDKLTKLSQTLLNLSRLHYEKLTHAPVAFNQLVAETINRYDTDGTRIELKQTGKPMTIDAHEPSVEELLTILIDNALKYSPETTKVHVSIGRRNSRACFKISNEGKGIEKKYLPHIFDRFYRADNARTSSEKTSFGLGLSLAKTIVELHHGELTVSSAPGATTTFTVLLPLMRRTAKSSTN